MNFEKPLNWKLNFLNEAYEKEYGISKHRFQNKVLKIFLLYTLLMALISWLINPRSMPVYGWRYLTALLGYIALSAGSYMISRKWPFWAGKILFFIYYISFFMLFETIEQSKDFWGRTTYFLMGTYFELLLGTIILSKIGWLKSTIIIVTSNLSCCFRYLPFSENTSTKYFPLVQFIINMIVLGLISYFVERNDRLHFYSNKKYEYSLLCFKELIKEVFPLPVIILQHNEVLFNNQEALNTFSSRSKEELLNKFKNVNIELNDFPEKLTENEVLLGGNTFLSNSRYFEQECFEFKGLTLFDYLQKTEEIEKSTFKNFRSLYFSDKDNSPQYFDLKAKSIIWENKHAIMIIVAENKMILRNIYLREQTLYKDTLLASVSHDLRTPLNGLIGMMNESVELDDVIQIKENLNIALCSSQQLFFMINDILDYQQILNGKLRLIVDEFSLENLLDESANLFKYEAKLKGIEIFMENNIKTRNKGGVIRSDRSRLKQVINNLLGNALKFTQQGSIRIILEEYEDIIVSNQNNAHLNSGFIIKVIDTGTGIKKEDLPKLFKLFGNLNSSEANRNLNKYGMSFGLAISQHIIKILNNNMENEEIKVISDLGKGSCFYFHLTSISEENNEENFNSFIEEAHERSKFFINKTYEGIHNPFKIKSHRILNILIVDDDQINILVTSSYLKSYQLCAYETACNGLEAIEKVKTNAEKKNYYDFILMDCNMPIMNGYEATRQIRSLIKEEIIPYVFIIACTANVSYEDYKQCFKSGMNDYISKPFSKRDLISKIESFIKTS